ncbi:MAG: hypothetical protein M3014_13140 [Chloroflexota bacterium]|nr:hypothetical protein [Chloroflexota bacterium]
MTAGDNESAMPLVREQPVMLIPIDMDVANAELSGLAWYGDRLILLPQYPNWAGTPGDGNVVMLAKSDIVAYIEGRSRTPLKPHNVPFITAGLEKSIEGFQGYEAMVVTGSHIYLTIEAEPQKMLGYIVRGNISPSGDEIRLDSRMLVKIAPEANIENASYETLVLAGDKLAAIFEANGANVNRNPVAHMFSLDLEPLGTLPFPNVEYRITDATHVDEEGLFWTMNDYYPGDSESYKPAPDPLIARYGKGETHARSGAVERILQFSYSSRGISLMDRPPIQLQLLDTTHTRNWEGLVCLEERGFLIVTDGFPETLLGFVALPE